MWTVYSERLFQTQGTWTYVCGWGKASPSMHKALGLKGLMVGTDGEGPGVSPEEPSCNKFAFAKYQDLRKAAEL